MRNDKNSTAKDIVHKYRWEEELTSSELLLLVKGISVDGYEWVSGFFVKEKSSEYEGNKLKSKFISSIITEMSAGGFTKCQVIPMSVCKCTGRRDDTGRLLFEGDYLDENHYNEVTCTNGHFSINGDTPLEYFLPKDRSFHIFGHVYDIYCG